MNRTEFIEKLDALSEEIRLHEPEDIRRVKQRNRPAKKNFGALLFAFLDMEAANPDLYRLICMAQAGQGSLSLGVAADEIHSRLSEKGGRVRFSYMLDVDDASVSRNIVDITVKPTM